jgi:hypothetical protein
MDSLPIVILQNHLRVAVRRVSSYMGRVLLAFVLTCSVADFASSQDVVSEGALKAAIVVNLFLYVEWPETSSGYRLCVAGRGEIAEAVLARHGYVVKGQAIEAIRMPTPDAVPGRRCKILFLPVSTGARAAEFAQAAAGSSTLIVAEADVLALDSAHVVLGLDERGPALSINRTDARRVGLDFSSRLLKLARKVS